MKAFTKVLASAALVVGLAMAPVANAATIAIFGQSVGGAPFTAVNNGIGTTTFSALDIPVSFSFINSGGNPSGFLDLAASSLGIATTVGGNIAQQVTGSFSITSGSGNTGTNYLSGTFKGFFAGNGQSGGMAASTPLATDVTFTSGTIAALNLGLERAFSLSFTSLTPGVTIVNGSVSSFSSNVSGTMSANATTCEILGNCPVPEPASMSLLGMGLVSLGVVARRRRRS